MFGKIRLLEQSDFGKGYLNLLSQLTEVGDIDHADFAAHLEKINQNKASHQIWVVPNLENTQILATATLLIEPKFIHNCGAVGHIEDVVVLDAARGLGLGKKLIDHLVVQAKLNPKCYKVSLYCKPELARFYQKSNLVVKDTQMVFYF